MSCGGQMCCKVSKINISAVYPAWSWVQKHLFSFKLKSKVSHSVKLSLSLKKKLWNVLKAEMCLRSDCFWKGGELKEIYKNISGRRKRRSARTDAGLFFGRVGLQSRRLLTHHLANKWTLRNHLIRVMQISLSSAGVSGCLQRTVGVCIVARRLALFDHIDLYFSELGLETVQRDGGKRRLLLSHYSIRT